MKHLHALRQKMRAEEKFSSVARAQLKAYVRLLDRWRGVTNLISDLAFQEMWSRHIPDSVLLRNLLPERRKWLDLGAGAGLPGIVIGILLGETQDAQVHCVDSDGRKCTFLRTVVRELNIPVKIHNSRAELLSPETVGVIEVITAKAFASVDQILKLSDRFFNDGAVALLPRGKTSRAEIEELDPMRYDVKVHDDPESNGGFFLEVRRRTRRL